MPRRSSTLSYSDFTKQQFTIGADHITDRFRAPTIASAKRETGLEESGIFLAKWLTLPLGGQIQTQTEDDFSVGIYRNKKQDRDG